MNKELKLITADVKENTATTYTNNYKRLRDALGITDKRKLVKSVGLDKIESILLDDDFNANARAGMLTVCKKLFTSEKDKEKIDEIDEKIRQHKRDHQVKKNGELTETLPTYKEMISALKKLKTLVNILSIGYLYMQTHGMPMLLLLMFIVAFLADLLTLRNLTRNEIILC